MAESRKERERVLSDYRRQAEEKKEFKEKVERRVSCLFLSQLTHTLNSLQLRKASTHHQTGQGE